MYGIVDEFVLNNVDNIVSGKWLEDKDSKVYDYKFILIPFTSLGNKNGILLGFKPDYIRIYNNEGCSEKQVIVGIYTESLGGNSEYNAIVGL